MVDPGTAILIATAIATAAKGGGDAMASRAQQKAAKRKSREMERETSGSSLNDSMQRSAELEGHRLSSRNKLGKRKSQSMHDTASLMREAFKI